MARSLKLSNNDYWDTSSLYGGRILQSLGELSASGSMTITIPATTQGMIFVTQNNTSHGVYTFNVNSSGTTRVCTVSSVSAFTVSTGNGTITIANSGTITANVLAIATKRLTV